MIKEKCVIQGQIRRRATEPTRVWFGHAEIVVTAPRPGEKCGWALRVGKKQSWISIESDEDDVCILIRADEWDVLDGYVRHVLTTGSTVTAAPVDLAAPNLDLGLDVV